MALFVCACAAVSSGYGNCFQTYWKKLYLKFCFCSDDKNKM